MDTAAIVANVTAGGGWIYVPELDVCLSVPTKNGCSAIYGQLIGNPVHGARLSALKEFAARGLGPWLPHKIPGEYSHVPKFMAVREPVDRFASLWRCFCRRPKADPAPEPGTTASIFGMTPVELMAHIRKYPTWNRHWIPQVAHWTPGAILVPHDQLLDRLGLGSPKVNVTKRRDTDPEMPESQILGHYVQDLELWRARCT
jgi:hypothetical protein